MINCAAWTDVDGAEADPDGAHAVNAIGPANLARAPPHRPAPASCTSRPTTSSTASARDDAAPYVESDPTGPRSAYGASKLAGEQAIAAAAGVSHAIVRSSWLFGVGGRNFAATMLRARRRA